MVRCFYLHRVIGYRWKCSKSLTFQPKHCMYFPYSVCYRLGKRLVSWDSIGDLFGVINSDFFQASSIFSIARRKSFVSLVTYSYIDIGHSLHGSYCPSIEQMVQTCALLSVAIMCISIHGKWMKGGTSSIQSTVLWFTEENETVYPKVRLRSKDLRFYTST